MVFVTGLILVVVGLAVLHVHSACDKAFNYVHPYPGFDHEALIKDNQATFSQRPHRLIQKYLIMSSLKFSPSVIGFATATLAAIALAFPTLYFLESSSQPQDSTPHVQTFRKYIKSYSTLRPQALITNASQDFSHTVLPSSLHIPSRTLEPFKMHAAIIFSIFKEFEVVPQLTGRGDSVHFSPDTNTVVAHCKMGGRSIRIVNKGQSWLPKA